MTVHWEGGWRAAKPEPSAVASCRHRGDLHGQILGRHGSVGTANTCGGWGSTVELQGSPIYNAGIIQAGHGGSGDLCGGDGGSTYVLGRNTTNIGTICAGHGGDAVSTAPNARGGDGGETHVWGK